MYQEFACPYSRQECEAVIKVLQGTPSWRGWSGVEDGQVGYFSGKNVRDI